MLRTAALSSLVLSLVVCEVAHAEKMYWINRGMHIIQRANLDGSNIEDLVTSGLGQPQGIALDLTSGKMYWTDTNTDKIQRANFDGTDVEDLVTTVDSGEGLALDLWAGKIYWVARISRKIQRSNLDGSQIEDLVGDLPAPSAIALDHTEGKMYWTQGSNPGNERVRRANLDGSEIEDLVTSGLTSPSAIALDTSSRKMYWTDGFFADAKIQRANLDGSEIEDLVIGSLERPAGIALDIAAGKMYWTDHTTGKVQRANLDGTEVEDLVTVGLSSPRGIALDVCGNGFVDIGERCDDGNADNNDDCINTCENAECGDGHVWNQGSGTEECDDGPDNSDTEPDACRTNCITAHCCDGVVDTGEECDDGLDNSDTVPDACRTDCKQAWCGDGVADTGEECDDGNTESGDGCDESCLFDSGACCVGSACSAMMDTDCLDAAGSFFGFNSTCGAPDADGDGLRDECDGCPDDRNKIEPGTCGCGLDDNADSDGDGVPDCIDQCSGVDDALFGSDCAGAIPTAGTWGLLIISLSLLVIGKIAFGMRRRAAVDG